MTEAVPGLYLDYAATTPVDRRVAAAMNECLLADGDFGNPASAGHAWGRAAASRVHRARAQVAALIGSEPEALVWTSGATESINLAVLGRVRFAMARGRGRHVITGRTEHSATLAACHQLEREGAEVTWLAPDADGRLTTDAVLGALRDDTVLVTLMHVNNETGVLQPVTDLARAMTNHPASLHVDAAQSAGLFALDVADGIDLLSLSAHKFYGPKGVGALYVRRRPRLRLQPLVFGGEQEAGLRAGTLPVHQIVGMGVAAELARERREGDRERLTVLNARLLEGLERLEGVVLNGRGERAPHIVNASFVGVHGESLALAMEGVGLSAGSACTSAYATASHVLRAMGVADGLALASFRFSLGRGSTEAQIDEVLGRLAGELAEQRRRSPAWAGYRAGRDLDEIYRTGSAAP